MRFYIENFLQKNQTERKKKSVLEYEYKTQIYESTMINKLFNKVLILTVIPLFALFLLTACSDDNGAIVDPDPEPDTITDVVSDDDRFSILVQVVTDLGLEDVYSPG